MTPPKAKTRKVKIGSKTVKLDVGEFRDKTKEIEVEIGKTTVAEALVKAGYTVDQQKPAHEDGWRLSGHKCDWTDKITGAKPTRYRLPAVKAG